MSMFQLIAVLFALFMIYVVRVKNRRYKLSTPETVGWYGLWISFVVLALFPTLLTGIVDTLKFGRVFDLLVVGAFMIISIFVTFSYFKIKELDQKLEKYTREEALKVKKSTSGRD